MKPDNEARELRQRLVYAVLQRAQRGEALRAIARAERVSRKTVRRIIKQMAQRREEGNEAAQRAAQRTPRASKLDPFVATIRELMSRYPEIRATRLLEELRLVGFDGGYTIVADYLRRNRHKPSPRAYERVVTEAGEQAQVDWSPYRINDGSRIYAGCVSAADYAASSSADFCLSSEGKRGTILSSSMGITSA